MGESRRCFESKTATLYMQEETLAAQNIKETLTRDLRDVRTQTYTHTHGYPNLEIPLLPFMAVIIKYILRLRGHAEDRQQPRLKSMCRLGRRRRAAD